MNNDFCKYMFQHFENAYNIGWNENKVLEDKISKQIVDDKFIDCLSKFCEGPINKELNGKHRQIEIDGSKYVMGFGEIRILDTERKIRYAAPNIILYDILDGLYIPPVEFVQAVKNAPSLHDIEYREFLSRYNEENFWGEDEDNVKKIITVEKSFSKGINELRSVIESEDVINCVTKKGSLLNYAIQNGHIDEALYLIDSGININAFGGIKLLSAIEKNMSEVAQLLIDKNISMESSEMGMNPLICAIR